MKKGRFSEAQIVAILGELEAGTPATQLARRHGVHANTVLSWRKKYAGMHASELARLRQLEDENRRMQRIIARQTIELDAVRELIAKNGWGPRREVKR